MPSKKVEGKGNAKEVQRGCLSISKTACGLSIQLVRPLWMAFEHEAVHESLSRPS